MERARGLEERLAPYGATPTLTSEMHSILGSEVEGLSPVLEAHYAHYFSNRAVIVAAHQRTLGDRENEIRNLKGLLAELEARIKALSDVQEQRRKAVSSGVTTTSSAAESPGDGVSQDAPLGRASRCARYRSLK